MAPTQNAPIFWAFRAFSIRKKAQEKPSARRMWNIHSATLFIFFLVFFHKKGDGNVLQCWRSTFTCASSVAITRKKHPSLFFTFLWAFFTSSSSAKEDTETNEIPATTHWLTLTFCKINGNQKINDFWREEQLSLLLIKELATHFLCQVQKICDTLWYETHTLHAYTTHNSCFQFSFTCIANLWQ